MVSELEGGSRKGKNRIVLILILLEDGQWGSMYTQEEVVYNGLNPYSIGRWSVSLGFSGGKDSQVVS